MKWGIWWSPRSSRSMRRFRATAFSMQTLIFGCEIPSPLLPFFCCSGALPVRSRDSSCDPRSACPPAVLCVCTFCAADMSSLSWCPTPNCNTRAVRNSDGDMLCHSCNLVFCRDCSRAPHHGLSCEENRQQLMQRDAHAEEEAATERLIQRRFVKVSCGRRRPVFPWLGSHVSDTCSHVAYCSVRTAAEC